MGLSRTRQGMLVAILGIWQILMRTAQGQGQ
ncbi:hypothetical protein BDE02_06G157700 [Populus trichocarpa]|nr:hypothetical protein BDE02_06G157700 [Populus trichocarpa]